MLWINGRRVQIDRSRGARYYRPWKGRGTWVRVEPVNELVWAGFRELMLHPETIAALLEQEGAPADRDAEILAMEKRRGKLLARIDRLVVMRADGEIDRETLAAQSGAAQSQIRSLEESIRSARRQVEALRSGWARDTIAQVADLVTQPLEPAMQRQALHSVVHRVDATVRRQAQPKVRGRWVSGRQWVVDDVHLGFRHPVPSTHC